MPIERRSASRQTTILIASVAALLVALGLVVAAMSAASRNTPPSVRAGKQARFDAGLAKERATSIAEDGPLLFSDVSGSGQRLPVFISHEGDDHKTGWNVIGAHPPDAPEDCFLEWSHKRKLFHAVCVDATYPADGGDLPHYGWEVDEDGRLLIDLRSPTTNPG
ncbi:MAG: hypothetical protein IT195_00305 [Microthrixaceae bacterium]|nr:hypothetical protein [Microthrixaceae bacterium]